MKFVCCPFSDTVFSVIGFRPMEFSCPVCGSIGEWYDGKAAYGIDRGFIRYLATDSVFFYWEEQIQNYITAAKKVLDQIKPMAQLIKALINSGRAILAAKLAEAIAEKDLIKAAQISGLITQLTALSVLWDDIVSQYTDEISQMVNKMPTYLSQLLGDIEAENQDCLSSDNPSAVKTNNSETVIIPLYKEALQEVLRKFSDFSSKLSLFLSRVIGVITSV